jgi:hypothetical protein
MDTEKEIARIILAMSDDDRGAFAADLCANLEGYSFVRDGSDENMDDDHVMKALTEWAQDELRTGG